MSSHHPNRDRYDLNANADRFIALAAASLFALLLLRILFAAAKALLDPIVRLRPHSSHGLIGALVWAALLGIAVVMLLRTRAVARRRGGREVSLRVLALIAPYWLPEPTDATARHAVHAAYFAMVGLALASVLIARAHGRFRRHSSVAAHNQQLGDVDVDHDLVAAPTRQPHPWLRPTSSSCPTSTTSACRSRRLRCPSA